jgi:hypothetical protein
MGIELWHVLEWVADDVSNDSKPIGEISNNWSNLECDWLVFLLRLDIRRAIVGINVGRGRRRVVRSLSDLFAGIR